MALEPRKNQTKAYMMQKACDLKEVSEANTQLSDQARRGGIDGRLFYEQWKPVYLSTLGMSADEVLQKMEDHIWDPAPETDFEIEFATDSEIESATDWDEGSEHRHTTDENTMDDSSNLSGSDDEESVTHEKLTTESPEPIPTMELPPPEKFNWADDVEEAEAAALSLNNDALSEPADEGAVGESADITSNPPMRTYEEDEDEDEDNDYDDGFCLDVEDTWCHAARMFHWQALAIFMTVLVKERLQDDIETALRIYDPHWEDKIIEEMEQHSLSMKRDRKREPSSLRKQVE